MRAPLLVALLALAGGAQAACPPAGHDEASLQVLKAEGAAVVDEGGRLALAVELVDCLGHPEPSLRDGIAYGLIADWMRAGAFDAEGLRTLREALYEALDGPEGDGFARPFAVLVLSEVARTDRVAPWMDPAERDGMLDRATDYVAGVRDYRGHDNDAGWRHGVAHGADWLMQLVLNPALERGQLDRILAAVATQVVPESAHAYVFDEPARLARPVLYVAARGLHTGTEWQSWFAALPPGLGDAALAHADDGWLARRHDLVAFLQAVYVAADRSGNESVRALKPAADAALKAIP
ncbi:DUF2785 domain-containing protein [Luteimonas arsenica]|uniref:DUF2785 domain-containing protein n=1 Tax=Luteimonas arsenica TaxID=1586242 RepID=UPI0010561212|nr:DUF2785 domain-containing protein [Luteimonas arsenica]